MLNAKQENAMTLAAALGIPEDEAGELLKCKVVITHYPLCNFARVIASSAAALLGRMMDMTESDDATRTIELIVGNAEPVARTKNRVYVRAQSDCIVISRDGGGPSIANPDFHRVFARLSGCYAAAAVTRMLLDPTNKNSTPVVIRPNELLGADLHKISQPVNLGDAVLAGAGAVANGFLVGLCMFDVSGTLHIVDPKKVAPGILNRCLWFEADDVGYAKSDQLVLRAQSSFPRLRLVSAEMTVADFMRKKLDSGRIERMIVSVDSRRARRALQTELPREVYDASTTGIEEVVLHFNQRPSELACMSCIYSESDGELSHEAHVADLLGVTVDDVKSGFITEHAARQIWRRYPHVPINEMQGRAYDTLFKQLCGTGELKTKAGQQILAPFSFVPVLAGTYLAIELVRRLAGGSDNMPFNYWRASPWVSPNVELQRLRRPVANCEFCANPLLLAIEKSIWGSAEK